MKNKHIWLIVIIVFAVIVGLVLGKSKGNDQKTVKIGNILYMSGPLAALGEQELNGMKMAEEYINLNGGIQGKKLEIITQDYAGDSKKAIAAYEFLKNQKINSLLIDGGSAISSVIPLIRKDGVFGMVPVAVTPTYFDGDAKTCRIAVTADRYAVGISDYLQKRFSIPKIAFLVSANEYGNAVKSEITKSIEKIGGRVVVVEDYEPTAVDFRTQITKLKEKQEVIDALVVINANSSVETMLRQIQQLGFNKPIISDTFTILNAALKDQTVANGVIFVDYSFTSLPDQKDGEKLALFKKEYHSRYGKYPAVASINGYDAVILMAEAVKNTKQNTSTALSNYLVSHTEKFGMVGGEMKFNSDCEVERDIVMRVMKGGEIELVK